MSLRSRPLWFEGQLIRPQHLQQMQRWLEAGTEQRGFAAAPLSWGVASLKLDATLLQVGKISLERCQAILPDGTFVDVPGTDEAPPPFTPKTAGVVSLCVPARRGDAAEVGMDAARYRASAEEVRDSTGSAISAQVQVGSPNLSLASGAEASGDLIRLPIARVSSIEASGALTLDSAFIPPVLRMGAHPRLAGLAREIGGMLTARGNMLVDMVDPSRAGTGIATMVDFALLQVVNSFEPVFASLAAAEDARPIDLYWEALRLAGELATFSRRRRRPGELPQWRHEEPGVPLAALARSIRDTLGALSVDTAVALPLELKAPGVWISPISDRSLLTGATFVLAVAAAVEPERIRTLVPAQAKLGPAEAILNLVNLQLPGIALHPMPVAPNEIPYRTGTVYFELERSGELWRAMASSPAFVFHLGADLPGIVLDFWAIRKS